jgi:mono/diheme cytochrome c family protein
MRLLAFIGGLGIIVAVCAAVFFFGGFFNVAATEEDPGIVKWALIKVRMASMVRHAGPAPTINLDDSAIVQAGARVFATRGCVNCHGAPGAPWQKFSEGLRPDPPDLSEVGQEHEPEQIFWVIKNGIKMTGMPSFQLAGVEDKEIWSIVAFVKKLPKVSEAEFKAWSTAP